jgi:hypothetical protein
MLQETKKTHKEVKTPQISIPQLADYMAASEQRQRTIAQDCKYRSTARVVQHADARIVVTNHILSGAKGAGGLQAKADAIRNKLSDSDFEADINDHSADYVERFAEIVSAVDLPSGAELSPPGTFAPLILHGVKVTFRPQIMLRRVTKTNKVKSGALMLRYAKGKPLSVNVAGYQSAAIFGYMATLNGKDMAEAERMLCITLDAYAGLCHDAPSNAIYLFKNMSAACATIGEWWPGIKPPKNAVL